MLTPELLYHALSTEVKAFSTLRGGGCSTGAYASFNLNPYCGDDSCAVARNRTALTSLLNINESHLLLAHQCHGTEIRQIGPDFFTLPPDVRTMILEGVDALMTNLPHVCIGVSTADCIPLLLFDPVHQALCAVHAGWRGTVRHMALKAVTAMRAAYDTHPQDVRAVIGPGISLEHFEVGDEVVETFRTAGFPMERIARRFTKWHIDLPLCNALQLEMAGLLPQNIIHTHLCTYTEHTRFFSARRLGTASGRIYSGIMLTSR